MRVELRDIHKSFGSVRANAGISLEIPAGAIQGILGENGAGKSTLMKVLSGFHRPDSGEILLDGHRGHIRSPADAIALGIGMLHQDPLDFPPLKALENFILGRRERRLALGRRAALKAFRALARQFDFALDPDSWVDSLTVGERQQLEILRLLWLGARLLILDEPTTGISLQQKEKLFATLSALAAGGVTVVFVSHKLDEVERLCGQVAVLRQGALAGTATPPYLTSRLVAMMFGRAVSVCAERRPNVRGRPAVRDRAGPPGRPVLSLEQVSFADARLEVRGVSLEIHAGEIIGLAGMEGSGQALLLRACAGLAAPASGTIHFGTSDLTGQPYRSYRKRGIVYLPAARLEQALVPGLTLAEHFILSERLRGLFVDRRRAGELAQARIASYSVRGAPMDSVESLSGGNQQRLMLALLPDALSLVLMEHPTRGLDVESTVYIWGKMRERCEGGTAVAFVSSDLDETLQYSDRILVFFAGCVSPPLPANQVSVEELGQLIGGKGWELVYGKAPRA